mgnify:CR=1 FL=1
MKKFLSPFVIGLSIFCFTDVNGNEYSFSKDNFYLSLGSGVIVPYDTSFEETGSAVVGGLTINSISGDIKYDTGYQISGIIGYDINKNFAFETELLYSNFDYDSVDVNAAGTITGTGAAVTFNIGSFDIDGNISAFSMLFGPKFSFELIENLEGYLGGSVGFTSYNEDVKSIAADTTLSYEEDNVEFSSKFKAGLNYSVDDNISLQFDYGFNYVSASYDIYDDFTANSFTARFNYSF